MKQIVSTLVLGLGWLASLNTTSAATRAWNPPGGDRQWTNAANWTGGAPVAGDTLVFAAPPGFSECTNTFPVDTTFAQLIYGQPVRPYGNRIQLTGGILSTNSGTVNFDLPLRLAGNAVIEQRVANPGQDFWLMNAMDLGANSLTCTTAVTAATIALGGTFSPSVLSGSGTLRKTGPGTLKVSTIATNFTGPVVIEAGEVRLQTGNGFGSTNTPTEIRAGATLWMDSGNNYAEPALLAGTLGSIGNGGNWTGPITLTNGGGALEARQLTCLIAGPVLGSGTLRLRSAAGQSVLFFGSASNTFSGDTVLEAACSANAQRDPGTTVIPGNLLLEANSDFALGASDQIADTATVTLQAGARLNLGSRSETFRRLELHASRAQVFGGALGIQDRVDTGTAGSSWVGLAVDTPTDGFLRLLSTTNVVFNVSNSPAATDFYVGVALTSTNSVGLWKTGPGRMVVGSSSNAISGVTRIVEGELFVNGSATNEHQLAGGTLGGTGIVGRITATAAGGTLAPGTSAGRLLSSNVVLNSAVTFAVELNGTNAGVDYDQLGVRGTITLASAALSLSVSNGFNPPIGTTFLILTNDAADAISGTFAGLPQGGRLTNNLIVFAISYTGGDGNDLMLTVTNAVTPPATRVWSGAGGDGRWSNPVNWTGGSAPLPGDLLVFTGGGGTTSNDFAGGTTFGSVAITDGAWTFLGAAFTTTGGLTVSNASGPVAFSNAIAFAGCGLTNLSAQVLRFGGALDAGSATLPVLAGGAIEINSTLAGANGFLKLGAASLTLAGNNTALLGTNRLDNGSVIVTGTATNRYELNGGGVSGTGSVGALTSTGGGDISPGTTGPGILTARGNVIGNGATTFSFQLNGTNPGTEYDQLGVRGTVNLGGAALQLVVTFAAPSNTVFLILTNDSNDAITGTFAGLAESSTLTNNGTVFRISYTGGTGNDVTLTSLGPPPAPPFVLSQWDGDQSLPQWSWPNNWVGNTLPAAGNALYFTGGAQLTTVNDLAPGITYHSLRIYGNAWDLSGNALTLQSGLVLTGFNLGSAIRMPLTLAASQGFTNLPEPGFSGGRLTLGGTIDLGAHTLTFAATAPIEATNLITGTGGLVKLGTNELFLNASNAFTGPVALNQGTLYLRNARALGTTDNGTTVASNSTLHLIGSINSPEAVFLGGTLASSNGNGRVSGTLTVSNLARFNVTGTAQLTVGPVTGNASVDKLGSGSLVFTGSGHTHTGAVRVAAGRVLFNGTTRGTSFAVSANPTNAVLAGTGTLGNAILTNTSGAVTIAPGPAAGGPDLLTISNLLNTSASNVFAVQLAGTNAATPEFDVLAVNGTAALGGMQLSLSPSFTPAIGARFVIVRNDGVDPVSGTFAGLPEGATLLASNVTFRVSYAGGDGNDVELTVVPVGQPSNFTDIAPLTNNLLRLTATGTPTTAYALVATTNLVQPVNLWTPVTTNTSDGAGRLEFILNDRTNFPQRFYLIRSP